MEAVAAGDHVAAQHVLLPVLAVADARLVAVDIAQRHVLRLEHQRIALLEAERDQILDHFGLTIDHDGRAAGQLRQWDAVALAVELQLDAMVDDALARQPFAGADLRQDVDGALLQDTRARSRCSQYSRLRLSSTTDSIPRHLSSCASVNPAGPAPTIPT